MTVDSVTEVLVGMAPDILTVIRLRFEFCVEVNGQESCSALVEIFGDEKRQAERAAAGLFAQTSPPTTKEGAMTI